MVGDKRKKVMKKKKKKHDYNINVNNKKRTDGKMKNNGITEDKEEKDNPLIKKEMITH